MDDLNSIFYRNVAEIQSRFERITSAIPNCNLVSQFFTTFQRFNTGKVIPNYDDWLKKLRSHADQVQNSPLTCVEVKRIVDSMATLIEDISYGGASRYHVGSSSSLLAEIEAFLVKSNSA